MDTYWKDEGGEDETFWEHEWGKHGTCYSTLDPSCYVNYTPQEEVVDFFQRTVDLFMELNTYKFLADAGIVPSATKNYTSAEVLAALNKPRGVNASIECYHGQLDEVYYFYDVAGTIAEGKFVPQNPVGESSDCPASLQYLPKNISSTPTANDTIPPAPFIGKGYVLVEAKHAGKEVGCLNAAGAFVSSVTNTSCAVFTGKASGNAVTLASTRGSCSVHNSELICGSSVSTPTLFNDVTGNLAYNNKTKFYATAIATGSEQSTVYTSKNNKVLGITWEALSGSGFTAR
ncbi:ribonuclease T2-like [Xylographa pallens]|nr:ribonuclease T2-like [Xylographa pallens]